MARKRKISEQAAARQFAEIENLFEDAAQAYSERRRDREFENAGMFRGYHYIDRGERTQTRLIEDEAIEVQNIIRPVVRAAVASRLRQFPQIAIANLRGDVAARARAQASEGLCQAALHNGVIDWEEIERCASWACQAGLGFIKTFWDPNAGRQIPQESDFWEDEVGNEEERNDFEFDEFGSEVKAQLAEGDVRTMFVPSTDGLPNPDARSWREVRHFFHVRLLPVSQILDMHSEDMWGKKLTPGDLDSGSNSHGDVATEFRRLEMDDEATGTTAYETGNSLAQLVEFWELPSQRHKNGRFAIFSGSRIIWIGPNWLEPKRIPFVPFFGDCKVPASLYPDGVVEDLKSPQRSLNRTATKMREHLDKVLNSHLLVPYQSNINLNTWSTKPGQLIRYQSGYKPEFVDTPQIPPSTFDYVQSLRDVMQEISGYSDVVRGTGVQGEMSGRAAAFARENQELTREPEMISHRNSMVMLLQHYLWWVRQMYDDGRLVRLLGENDTFESIEFFAEDFDLQNELVVDVYNGAPSSPAMILSEVLELKERGVFDDDPGAERARSILGRGYSRALTYDPWQADRQRARREELIIKRGWPVEIAAMTFDVHEIHLECHNEFRKSYEYEKLNPTQKQLFDLHCSQHEEMLLLQQYDYGQQQAALTGGAGAAAPQLMPEQGAGGFEDARSPMDGGNAAFPTQDEALQPYAGDPGGAQAQDAGASTFDPMQG